ncbi:DUF2726 domain-containing protein [Erythrobacter sp. WG]|uniref:DUF2726 domain-containing protein n=1 Tax=Erythrobacter sp. WG TaxID=2985510 RepID=UPI00226D9783|nr:DUF2726 domain-containing protein [Erythrobacter sp. WG]MCX9147287.1 DUF2726 domain-containing protein [Erythrobacter sp. WG]
MDGAAQFLTGPWPLTALIISIVLFCGALVLSLTVIDEKIKIAKRKAFWAGRRSGGAANGNKADFAAEQLKKVASAPFTARPLLNTPEAKVFETLRQTVVARNPRWQVMAQVSVGEFLASPDAEAFRAVNSKRVDFALMDENCCVRHALEYQGSGHHVESSAAARDAVKKEALRKAGIGYHEVVAGHTTPSELRALVEKLVPAGRGATRDGGETVRAVGA